MSKFKLSLFKENNLFLSLVIAIFSLLRIPSIIEPDWYGDEGIYQVMGMAMARGRLLYKEIWDNKPPLLYAIYALFNGDLFYVRLFSLIIGIFTVITFYYLSKKIFSKKISIYSSTIVFAFLFATPILEGNVANAENFMLLPIIASAYLIFAAEKRTLFKFFLSGLLLSIAFLIKTVAVFDFAAFFVFILISRFYEDFSIKEIVSYVIKSVKKKTLFISFDKELIYIASFAFLIIITFIFFIINNAIIDYYKAAFSQNVGYVGYGNYFLFPMGLLFFKMLSVVVLILLFAKYRKIIGGKALFIFIWLIFSVFNALFSERPYTHYLLVLLPSFSLFLGYIFENKKLLKTNLIILAFLFYISINNFHIYTKLFPYYSNYFSFVFGKEKLQVYQSFFDRSTPRDYSIASFIKSKTNKTDTIFMWGDSGQIYALSDKLPPGRYIVSYHITFYKDAIIETKNKIDIMKPKYIISTKDNYPAQLLFESYNLKYELENAKIYERQIE